MRREGIIEDPQVRELFASELTALREAFEVTHFPLGVFLHGGLTWETTLQTWKPTTKVLKDVKLKLEGIRML